MYQSIHEKLFGSYVIKLPVMTVLRQSVEDLPARVDEEKNWVKLTFLTGLKLNVKGKQLLPPTLTEKSFLPQLRQFVRKTASLPARFKGNDPIEIELAHHLNPA